MELHNHIRALRRERGMTQEQLAEAMDVSAAAVSKWENGQSVPDISLLTLLADFFEVSLDALVGYEARPHRREEMVARIRQMTMRRADEVVPEVREALRRYPNHFDVVWTAARAMGFRGMEKHDEAAIREALALLDRARALLPQNTDPTIRRENILAAQGMYWTCLGEHAKAIACYEEGNVSGINDVAIGNCYAEMGQYEEALIPLSRGMATHLSLLYNALHGLTMVRANMGHEEEAAEIAHWCAGMLSGLEATPGSYIWRMRSLMLICVAVLSSARGKEQAAREALREAIGYARRYDAAPDMTTGGIRFYYAEHRGISDDVDESAMDALEKAVLNSGDEKLARLMYDLLET